MKKLAASFIFVMTIAASAYAQSTTQSTSPKQAGTATEGNNRTGNKNEGTDTQGTTQGANHEVGNNKATTPGKAGQVNGSNTTSGTGKEGNQAKGKSNVSKMNKEGAPEKKTGEKSADAAKDSRGSTPKK